MTAEKKTGEAAMVASTGAGGAPAVARFFYLTRGLWNLGAVGLALAVKAAAGSSVPPWAFGLLGAVVLATQAWRIWAAGFVGRAARGGQPAAGAMVTAGPYALVRNPMYLGTVIGVLAFAGMSGLWPVVLADGFIVGVVYAGAVAYEEAFLAGRFGETYRRYRQAVHRFIPALRIYSDRRGRFRLADGLANETGSLVFLPLFFVLFWFIG
jgi:protein-S-isoprenylcysteine O-methyltransferase Ste14